MKLIINLKEHKNTIILICIAIIWLFSTYHLVFAPYNLMKYRDRIEKETEIRLEKVQREFENIEKIYEKRLEENRKAEEKYLQYEQNLISKSFENIGILEEFIQNKIDKNSLQLKSTGSIEVSNSDRREKGKVFISYEVIGDEENIENFIKDLENTERLISITDNSIVLKNSESIINLSFKISSYLLNTSLEKNKIYDRKKDRAYISFKNLNIIDFKILKLNGKEYAVIKYKNGGRKILYDGEDIEIEEKNYKIKIKDEGIYLEHREKK